VPDSKNLSNTKDIGEEPVHGKTDMDGDPHELTPRTYSIKRIEDCINQIDIDVITVDAQGERLHICWSSFERPTSQQLKALD
jgi:hypothetical protein